VTSAAPASQRREYFRVNDRVLLAFRRADQEPLIETDPSTARLTGGAASFVLVSQLAQIGRDTYAVRQTLALRHPDLMAYLDTLEERVNLVVHHTLLQSLGAAHAGEGHEVNLSGGGVQFGSEESYIAGTLLEVRMVLLPSYIGMVLKGRVIRTEPNPSPSVHAPFRVAVEFVDPREADLKVLLKHTMEKQTNTRRQV
jgi:hypothetical protein